ncbi:MAG: hypothetical protein AB1304_07735 [Bacteroidota bacterium]
MNTQKIKIITIVLIIIKAHCGYCQSLDNIKKQSILLVHSDFTNFSLLSNDVDSIIKNYSIKLLNSEGIHGWLFFQITPICNECQECSYFIAYSENEQSFFRLKGFKNNDFTQFFNLLLNSNYFPELKNKNYKRNIYRLSNLVKIEKIELSKLYSCYFKKYKASLFDTSSCYRKSFYIQYCNPKIIDN